MFLFYDGIRNLSVFLYHQQGRALCTREGRDTHVTDWVTETPCGLYIRISGFCLWQETKPRHYTHLFLDACIESRPECLYRTKLYEVFMRRYRGMGLRRSSGGSLETVDAMYGFNCNRKGRDGTTKCRQVERHDYANNKAALDEHVLQILYLESGKVGEHQLDLFESIDNELSLAGVTTFLGSSITFVKTLSCSLCGERQTFLGCC